MPFDCRRANEAEMPFQYSIGRSGDFFRQLSTGSDFREWIIQELLPWIYSYKIEAIPPLMHFCSICSISEMDQELYLEGDTFPNKMHPPICRKSI